MRFSIRDFCPEDFEVLHQIDQSCFPPGIAYSRRELAYYMKLKGAFTLVAETTHKNSEIAGFIVGQRHPRGMGHIITIDTVKQFRRYGLGTQLMSAAEDRLRGQGCDAIFLEVAVDNMSAIRFYKKLDYFILKTIPHYYQNKLDAFMMAKRLAPTPENR